MGGMKKLFLPSTPSPLALVPAAPVSPAPEGVFDKVEGSDSAARRRFKSKSAPSHGDAVRNPSMSKPLVEPSDQQTTADEKMSSDSDSAPLPTAATASDSLPNEEDPLQQDNKEQISVDLKTKKSKDLEEGSAKEISEKNDKHDTSDALEDPDDDDDYDYDYDDTDGDNTSEDTYGQSIPLEFLDRLRTFNLFNKAPKSFHTKVASKLSLMRFHPQDCIISKNDPAKAMYWILRGSVSVTSPDGETIYAELARGQFFGEIGILFNRPRTATVIARTKVLVGVLARDALNQVLKSYPSIERRIRDEAQERLAMQEKKIKLDLPVLIAKHSNYMYQPHKHGINALKMATAAGHAMPVPSIAPLNGDFRSMSPSPPPSISAASAAATIGSTTSPALSHRLLEGADPNHQLSTSSYASSSRSTLHGPGGQLHLPHPTPLHPPSGSQSLILPKGSSTPTSPMSAAFMQRSSFKDSSRNYSLPLPKNSDNVDSTISVQEFLKNLPIFQSLPLKQLHQLALLVDPLHYRSFETIFKRGDVSSDIYFIIHGEVEVVISHDSPNQSNVPRIDTILGRLYAGSYFGEMSFLSLINEGPKSETVRSATIRSVTNVELIVVKSESLLKLCQEYPFIADHFRQTAKKRRSENATTTTAAAAATVESPSKNTIGIESEAKDKKKLSIDYLINGKESSPTSKAFDGWRLPQFEDPNFSPSDELEDAVSRPESPPIMGQSQFPLFNSNWSFGTASTLQSSEKPIDVPSRINNESPTSHLGSRPGSPLSSTGDGTISRPISPASMLQSADSSSVTSLTKGWSSGVSNISVDDDRRVKRRKSSVSSSSMPMISLPPLNPVLPSINKFSNFQNDKVLPSFQYLPHNKRVRLQLIQARRRLSVLANQGTIPDRLLIKVFEYMSLPELMKLRCICKRWRSLLYTAPNLFRKLDLTPWNISIDDNVLCQITDFVGNRPELIDISNCFHITDEGFSYMVNEIGMHGRIKCIKMKSAWDVSAMAIMDLSVPSVGHHLEELDLSNCRRVRDNVLERLIGWDTSNTNQLDGTLQQQVLPRLPWGPGELPGLPEHDEEKDLEVGCKNLRSINVGYCKHLTDNIMFHIANHANKRLESLDLTRCTTITDVGFQYWAYRNFPNLKKLSLKDCTFLTDKSIIAIANAATNLEILDLNFCCAISDVSIEVLCLGCPNLRELDMSFCGSAVSDSSLVTISLHLRHLERLIIKGCIRVTRVGIDALLSGCSPMNYINISQCKNAHIYPGRVPAQKLQINPQTKSAFVTAGPYHNIIEIVI